MLANDFLGENVSRLGFGAMRLPLIDDQAVNIDQEQVDAMVDTAIESGVNYFDTAYPYHDGMSEIVLGKSLDRHARGSYYLASKFPGHQVADSYDPQAIFEEQLQKCGVDYFDFYLLHNVYEASIDVYLDERWGIIDYFIEQKRNGRIKHLGFSCHGRQEILERFLDYGAHVYANLLEDDPQTALLFKGGNIMEFCQIQLNYLDWTLQKAAKKTALLEDAGIPVIVMEPLRGGKLATLGQEQMNQLEVIAPGRTAAEWSFQWLLGIPNVKVILSGMSNLQQVEQNCQTFQTEVPLSEAEEGVLMDVAESLKDGVPCTACRYCTSTCPQHIDIPVMLAAYNDMQFATNFTVSMQMDAIPEGQRAQDCIKCGACIRMCPQGIDIPDALEKLADTLGQMKPWAEVCRERAAAAEKLKRS